MSKKEQAEKKNEKEDNLGGKGLPLIVHAQYIKDLSFENPNAPQTLLPGQKGPEMEINVNIGAREIEDEKLKDLYEVTLLLSATARRDDEVYFIAEIQYGALTSVQGMPENQHHPMLFIEVPKLMFPFARQILADMTANGGYPPLLLNPVDFQAMYVERFAGDLKKAAEEKKNGKAA